MLNFIQILMFAQHDMKRDFYLKFTFFFEPFIIQQPPSTPVFKRILNPFYISSPTSSSHLFAFIV